MIMMHPHEAKLAPEILSLGHSNHPIERVIGLLKDAGATAVADVRSSPYSGRSPWFNQREFKMTLQHEGLAYVFLGRELGGRPESPALFMGSVANYAAMAQTSEFTFGVERLLQGRHKHRIALVCSERDPLHCHRCLLVSRSLEAYAINVCHIHANGKLETQLEAEDRLLREEKLAEDDLLWPRNDRLAEAYLRRNRRVAFTQSKAEVEGEWPIAL